jgi:iron(III) transport system ATP-binding protein
VGLNMQAVSHRYDGPEILRDISLHVPPGEVVSLLGPSGCGKSTLLRLAAGLERLQRGRVVIDREKVADAASGFHVPPEQRGVGMMFQDYALFPHLTVRDNILFGMPKKNPRREQWLREALRRTGLDQQAGRYPHLLSGGQQQRVALLRALAREPRVLLLDEPFSGLDVTLRARVREDTLGLLRASPVSTLLVTHDPEEAMVLSDRILVMQQGRIVQSGTPAEIYHHPRSAFVAGLFGRLNRLPGRAAGGQVATPLGVFPCALPEGPAQVLIRPEGLRIAAAGRGARYDPAAEVIAVRLLGQASEVQIRLPTVPAGESACLRVWVPGLFSLGVGDQVVVTVDEEQVFVFPERDAEI